MESLDSTISPPTWTRPETLRLRALRSIPALAGVAVVGGSLVAGMMLADESSTTLITIPLPQIPAAPAPIHVTVDVPTTDPATDPWLRPAADAPAPVAPVLRVVRPSLDAECFGRVGADSSSPACSWDAGFPAISGDGREIANLVVDGQIGPVDVSIVFHDVATSKPTRTIRISRFDELDFEKQEAPAWRSKVERRVAAAQRALESGKFRTLRSLGEHQVAMTELVDPPANATEVYAQWSGATMRIVDPANNTVMWQHKFSAPGPRKIAKPDEECGGWELAQIRGYWDPATQVVVGLLLHHHGGCMCGSTTVTQVFSL